MVSNVIKLDHWAYSYIPKMMDKAICQSRQDLFSDF